MNTIVTDEVILRKECEDINSGEGLNVLINNMVKLMIESNGVGIAAPQVGVNKRLFLVLLDNNRVELFINPIIISKSEETEEDTEGCLSIPSICGTVERSKSIKIKYHNGKKFITETYEGFNARVIQHEYDHLEGILYIDKATNIMKQEELIDSLIKNN